MSEHKLNSKEKVMMAVLLFASMTTFMGGAAVAPALPQMSQAFPEASSTAISLVITLPGLSVAVAGFFVGAFADRVGKVRTLAISSVLFTLAGYAALVLNSIELILIARLILGVGISGIAVSTTALIADYFTGYALTRALALQSAAMGAGVLVLETAGGFLAEFGWRAPFWLYGIGLIILVGVVLFLREPEKDASAENAGDSASDEGSKLTAPAFPRKVVFYAVAGGAFLAFLDNITCFVYPGRLPFFVEELGSSSSISGMMLGMHGLSMTLSSLAQSKLVIRCGRERLLMGSFTLVGLGILVAAFIPNIPALFASAIIAGVGIGQIIPSLMQWMTSVATPETSGKITGCNTAAINLGQFACALAMPPILLATGSSAGLFFVAGIAEIVVGVVAVLVFSRLEAKSRSAII